MRSILKNFFGFFKNKEVTCYDRVKVKNVVTGETIEGHEAVKEYFEKEKKLADEFGTGLIFQVFRANLAAESLKEIQGGKLAEICVDGDFADGETLVKDVGFKIRSLISEKSVSDLSLKLSEGDNVSFFFAGRYMREELRFYPDHFMMLPAWIQCIVHSCSNEEFIALVQTALSKEPAESSR